MVLVLVRVRSPSGLVVYEYISTVHTACSNGGGIVPCCGADVGGGMFLGLSGTV